MPMERAVTEVVGVVRMADTLVQVTIMEDVIIASTRDTISKGMHPEVPYTELFWVESLSEAFTVHFGGLTMRYPYLQLTMTLIITIPILRLPM